VEKRHALGQGYQVIDAHERAAPMERERIAPYTCGSVLLPWDAGAREVQPVHYTYQHVALTPRTSRTHFNLPASTFHISASC
jgi:endonuclease I